MQDLTESKGDNSTFNGMDLVAFEVEYLTPNIRMM